MFLNKLYYQAGSIWFLNHGYILEMSENFKRKKKEGIIVDQLNRTIWEWVLGINIF